MSLIMVRYLPTSSKPYIEGIFSHDHSQSPLPLKYEQPLPKIDQIIHRDLLTNLSKNSSI